MVFNLFEVCPSKKIKALMNFVFIIIFFISGILKKITLVDG